MRVLIVYAMCDASCDFEWHVICLDAMCVAMIDAMRVDIVYAMCDACLHGGCHVRCQV